MEKIASIKEITPENLCKLSREDVYDLLNTVVRGLPKEERSYYMDIIRTVFDFRSISPTKNYLRKDMIAYGYKFFPIPQNDKLIMGIKRKTNDN